jgi:carbon monoxide dehydrogenase subunit G
MRFENEFTVQAPVGQVWETLLDVQRVAPCMPGAEVLEQTGENAYKVGVRVKLGPISLFYRGNVEIVEQDDAAHTATMRARAQETRGQGTANATVKMSLADSPGDASRARIETDLQLSGRAAAMGRGVIADVSQQLIGEFASNLQAMLGPAAAEAPASEPPAAGPPPAEPPPDGPPAAEPATAAPAAAGAPPAGGPTPSKPAPPPPGGASSALSAATLAAAVISSRLNNPRVLLATAGGLLVTAALAGYALGRARGS